MLTRSARSNKAKSVFFEEFNDIDIYTEDTAVGYRKLYAQLLSRHFKERFKINDVFPLGGRSAVLKACEGDVNKRSRPRVYIIDGDLYFLRGDNPELPGLFVLPAYCIENILVCEHAATEFLVDEDPAREYDQLKADLKFDEWISHNESLLIELFIIYAVSMEFTPELPTVSLKISDYLNGDTGFVDEAKIMAKIESRKNDILLANSEDIVNARIEALKDRIGSVSRKYDFISGKDYLLPLLYMRLRKVIKHSATSISLRHRFSKNCALDVLTGIDEKILRG